MRPSSAAASSTMPPAASCSKKALTPLTRAPFGFLLAIHARPSLPRHTGVGRERPGRWPIKHRSRRAAIRPGPCSRRRWLRRRTPRRRGSRPAMAPLSRLPRYMAASRSPVPCGADGRRRTKQAARVVARHEHVGEAVVVGRDRGGEHGRHAERPRGLPRLGGVADGQAGQPRQLEAVGRRQAGERQQLVADGGGRRFGEVEPFRRRRRTPDRTRRARAGWRGVRARRRRAPRRRAPASADSR